MKKRLFICADRCFPRGDAGANRILFMAKALQEREWEIIVFSIGKNEKKYYYLDEKCFVYEGIKYNNIATARNHIFRILEHNFLDGKKIVKLLKQYRASENDKILLYSSSYTFSKEIISFASKRRIKIACDIVEWHQPFQFKRGKRDIRYKLYKKFFDELVPQCGNVIAISRCLENHFREIGSHVTVIPIYIDTKSRKEIKHRIDNKKLHLIYPGNPYRKDDLLSMLQALNLLTVEQKRKVCFHLTGANESLLKQSISGNEKLLDDLVADKTVVLHSWMEYDRLMELYSIMDFALLARPINRVTEANFPSKIPELLNKGIPVITNKVGDVITYLNDGKDSILYDGEGADQCRLAIQRALELSEDERVNMRQNAYKSAETVFNYHLCADALDSFFQNLR